MMITSTSVSFNFQGVACVSLHRHRFVFLLCFCFVMSVGHTCEFETFNLHLTVLHRELVNTCMQLIA